MSNDPAMHLQALYEKIRDGEASTEELRRFIALTEEAPETLLPFPEWESAPEMPVTARLQSRILQMARPAKPLLRRLLPYAAAAAVLLAVVMLRAFLWPQAAQLSVETGRGEIRKLTLPDGTHVTLNAHSAIRFDDADERTVYLEGQAFFDVRQDASRPFVVRSGGLRTEVLGTSFDLRAYSQERPFIAVVSGKVRVKDEGGRNVILERGQQAIYDIHAQRFIQIDTDPSVMGSWQRGIISLDRNLRDVCADIERWYGVKIILASPGIGDYQLSGSQEVKSLESCLDAICFIFHLKYTIRDNSVRIYKK
ncbi:FecR family protein [Chitinophaga rhizosphaerae]|uniref:FecR family protein n=1 Tax=Chitinophaga rhizosphaerae TaxID=1864947 RepID=UPI000F801577|nr:FecR domain-containing protein [Chitinophaga rhizosphaerae]